MDQRNKLPGPQQKIVTNMDRAASGVASFPKRSCRAPYQKYKGQVQCGMRQGSNSQSTALAANHTGAAAGSGAAANTGSADLMQHLIWF